MTWKPVLILAVVGVVLILATSLAQPAPALAAPAVFASPVQAGCYLARLDRCKIHVEPFTINLATGKKLMYFQLVTIQGGTGIQRVIYDFHPDQSNPAPLSGNTFTPSLVAKDFGATCGQSYTLSLQGQDTGDASGFNLGLTNQFTCPKGTFFIRLPVIKNN